MSKSPSIVPDGEATGVIHVPQAAGRKPITVIATRALRETFDPVCIQQALNSRLAPGVTDLVLNPDAHRGYGAPIGSVLVSPTHIYPGPVGVDIKCSMSLLQFDLSAGEIEDRGLRRALIQAISERTPTGAGKGQRSVPRSRRISGELGKRCAIEGASRNICDALGIPRPWAGRCEDAWHRGHDGTPDSLERRLARLVRGNLFEKLEEKILQLGSYGSGNHFGECNVVETRDTP